MSNSVAHQNPFRDSGSLYGRKGRKYLNAAERRRVMKALSALPRDIELFGLMLLWTGARISEALAIRACDIQLEAGVVAIRTLKRRRPHIRELPLPPDFLAALNKHFALASSFSDAGWSDDPLWRFHRSTGWRYIRKACRAAGVQPTLSCPRSMRHGFGVGTLGAGIPITLVSRWLGHARLATTAVYGEAMGGEQREMAQKFWQAAA